MKRLMKSTLFVAATLCAVIMLFSSTAQAETTQCTSITTIPTTITTQGIYCLNGNLAGSLAGGSAILINTNNVTIDMNGFKLGNLAAGAGTEATGIYASQKKNITIRNGSIRGFYFGIYLHDYSPDTTSSGHLVEDVRFDGNTTVGIFVRGTGNIIRNNQVVKTGGSTVSADAYGILTYGPGVRVLNNDIIDVAGSSSPSHAIYIAPGEGSVVAGNRISNVTSTSSHAYGVYLRTSSGSVVEGNRISNVSPGVTGSAAGIQLDYTSNNITVSDNRIAGVASLGIAYVRSSSGIYMNNTVSGATTPFAGGSPAAGTNFSN